MKTLLFVCLLAAGTAAQAQGPQFGILTGPLYSSSDPMGQNVPDASRGWSAGAALQLGRQTEDVIYRFDAGYSRTGDLQSWCCNNPGGGASETFNNNFSVLGASANFVATVLGRGASTKAYLIGGLGWYAVTSSGSNASDPSQPALSTTVGAFGWNAGLGMRFSRFFIEARYTVIKDGAVPYSPPGVQESGQRQNLGTLPITVGIWF